MSLYIPNLILPPIGEYLHLRIDGNGYISAQISAYKYVCSLTDTDRKAIEIQPHGRCVDVDEMERFMSDTVQGDIRGYPYVDETWGEAFRWMDSRPTILPADHSADTGKMINDDSEYEESLDSRVVQALEHGFYATMYGEVYKPDRPIIFIKSGEAWWNPKLGGICFIWGYPGPDISIYRPGQYGITWALTEHELNGYCAADPKKEDK